MQLTIQKEQALFKMNSMYSFNASVLMAVCPWEMKINK